jgi:hypothetical protein
MPERKLARSGALHRDRIIDLEARPHHRILVVLDQDIRRPRAVLWMQGSLKTTKN